jgi:hypothetical protein
MNNVQASGNDPHIERVWATRPETEGILKDIYRQIEECDPSDLYHRGEEIDDKSYYRALDRVLGIVNLKLNEVKRR